MNQAPRLPNFFIVGAPKAGTTSLYNYLDQHDDVFMSPIKEPNYFASELRPENFCDSMQPRIAEQMLALSQYLQGDMREKRFGGLVCAWDDYLKLFQNANRQTAVGEATPCYLWSPSAPGNIAARIPGARIIMILRNPADRAFSQYLNMVSDGTVRGSFRERIRANLDCRDKRFGPAWPLLEFGLYHEQVARYLEAFPRAQIHIAYYEDLQRDPEQLVAGVLGFLGVAQVSCGDLSRRFHEPKVPRLPGLTYHLKKWGIWPHLRNLAPRPLGPRMRSLLVRSRASLTPARADRGFLIDYYRDDIRKLESLLNRDLGAWLKGP